jgi:hypothetical protein
MNINASADVANLTIKLSRLTRKIGINTHDYPLLSTGNPIQCLELAKRMVFYVVKEVAQDMINRRITDQSPDKRVVLAIFDVLRESTKKSQNTISADQFLADGYAEHKLLILIKLVEYVTPLAKNQMKLASPSPTKLSRVFVSPGSSCARSTSDASLSSSGDLSVADLSVVDLSLSQTQMHTPTQPQPSPAVSGGSLALDSDADAGPGQVTFDLSGGETKAVVAGGGPTEPEGESVPFIEGDQVFRQLMSTSGNANYDNKRFNESNSAAMTARCEALVQKQLVPFQKQMVNMVQELNMNIMRSNVHIDARLTMLESRLVQLENITRSRVGPSKPGTPQMR